LPKPIWNQGLLTRLIGSSEQQSLPKASLQAGQMSALQANLLKALQPQPQSIQHQALLQKVSKVEDIVTNLKADITSCNEIEK
jgi:hypothetical protein